MNRLSRFLVLTALIVATALPATAQTKDGTSVVRVWTTDQALVGELERAFDVWLYRAREGYALIQVTPDERRQLEEAGLVVEIDREQTATLVFEPPTEGGGIPGFSCYRTVEETYADLAQLAADNPTLATWTDIGDSWEKANTANPGYDIFVLKLGNRSVPGPKAPFVLISAMHAREYATAETATRFAEALIAGYGTDADATWLLDHSEIHIVPQLNPDGRKRAETGLSWRKNTNNDFCANSNSRGIDLNRNSTFFWGGAASSGSPCSGNFRGPTAASEPETDTIESYIATVFADQREDGLSDAAPPDTTGLFISLHSFGEFVLWPWEGLTTPSPNDAGITTLGRKFGFFTDYLACQTGLPPASGTTVDQAYGEYGVAGYTFELGTTFFQGCSTFENTIWPANRPALVYAAKAARRPYQEPGGPEVISPTVDVAGTTATLTVTADDTRSASNGCGTEPTQNVASVSYSIDTPPWLAGSPVAMAPADGTFDSSEETATATLDLSTLSPGQHLVYFFATDSGGNTGVPTAAFVQGGGGTQLFADGFESGDTTAWSVTIAP